MIIDHTHPEYKAKNNKLINGNKYNGAYYYSRDIVKYIIPNVKTDRNWVTVRLPDEPISDHSIVFIHNNRNPNYYEYLRNYHDLILVCSTERTATNVSYFGLSIVLPLSVNVKAVEKFKVKNKTKDVAYAGRLMKMNNKIPSSADILTNMPQSKLLREMAKYHKIYAVGLTAIQAKILGCEIGVYDSLYPDPKFWKVVDCLDAAKMLQKKLDEIDSI